MLDCLGFSCDCFPFDKSSYYAVVPTSLRTTLSDCEEISLCFWWVLKELKQGSHIIKERSIPRQKVVFSFLPFPYYKDASGFLEFLLKIPSLPAMIFKYQFSLGQFSLTWLTLTIYQRPSVTAEVFYHADSTSSWAPSLYRPLENSALIRIIAIINLLHIISCNLVHIVGPKQIFVVWFAIR